MQYMFVPRTKNSQNEDLSLAEIQEQIPTRVSVKGVELEVVDGCVEASSKLAAELATLGFEMRTRPSVTVKERPAPETPKHNPKTGGFPVPPKAAETEPDEDEDESESEDPEQEPEAQEEEASPPKSSRVQRVQRKG